MKKTSPRNTEAAMQNTPTRRYRHYKGGEYEWLCEATYERDPAIKMTVYRAANGTIWTRPSTMFHEMVEVDGRQVPRFALMD